MQQHAVGGNAAGSIDFSRGLSGGRGNLPQAAGIPQRRLQQTAPAAPAAKVTNVKHKDVLRSTILSRNREMVRGNSVVK